MPFFILITFLVVRGRPLPLRDVVAQVNPLVGSGRIRPIAIAVTFAAGTLLCLLVNANWATAVATTFAGAIVLLSLVVLIGYAG